MMTNTTAPTTEQLIAAHIATKGVTQCPPAAAQGAATSATQTKAAMKPTSEKTKKRVEKALNDERAKESKATTERKAKVAVKSGEVSAAEIAKEYGMTGKALRAILRRHMSKPEGGWSFDKAGAKKVRDILDARKSND